jgi:hypothetical protein
MKVLLELKTYTIKMNQALMNILQEDLVMVRQVKKYIQSSLEKDMSGNLVWLLEIITTS